jgi:hypothetical protein
MSADKFVFLSGRLSDCDFFSSGLKEVVCENQWIGLYSKAYNSNWATA